MNKFNFNIDIDDNNEKELSLLKKQYQQLSQKELYERSQFVDLKLPSGNLWATYNLGVKLSDLSEIDCEPSKWIGNYYAWGEIETKDSYSWENYKWCDNSVYTITKYNSKKCHATNPDNKWYLDRSDDVATLLLGEGYHIPTMKDVRELITYTYPHIVRNYNNIRGLNGVLLRAYEVERGLFFPVTYRKVDSKLYIENSNRSECYFWISSLAGYKCEYGNCACFSFDSINVASIQNVDNHITGIARCCGLPVRAVFNSKI